MTGDQAQDGPIGQRGQRAALGVGVAGAVVCVLGAVLDPQQFFFAYLTAFMFWLGLPLGAMAIWMLHYLTGGAWGVLIRRQLEAASRTLPLLAVLFVPIAAGMSYLYPWVNPQQATENQAQLWKLHKDELKGVLPEFQQHLLEHRQLPEHEKHLLAHKAPYLNVTFFLIRAACYFLVWLGLAFVLNRGASLQDQEGGAEAARRFSAVSGPGLVVYTLTMTFAAVDWIMSLEPFWWSTIFAVIVATGQLLPALAFVILSAASLARHRPLADVTSPGAWNDLSSLLLAFVMLWTYMMFSQLLLVYSGNLVEEIPWYTIRSQGGWQWIGILLAVFYFALPFFLLLSRGNKRDPQRLSRVTVLILCMSFIHQVWMIGPVYSPGRFYLSWMAPAALAAIGGLWLALFLRQLRARPLVPLNDPSIANALEYRAEAHHV